MLENIENDENVYIELTSDSTIIQGGGDVEDVYQNGTSVLGADHIARVTTPTKTSDLTNDSGFITSSSLPTKTSDLTNDGDGTNPFLTTHQSLANYSTTTEMNTAIANHHDSTKQDTLPSVTNDRYLHTNSSTGALEWSEVSGGVPVLTGSGEPTTSTIGQIGQLYIDTRGNYKGIYICYSISGSDYLWTLIANISPFSTNFGVFLGKDATGMGAYYNTAIGISAGAGYQGTAIGYEARALSSGVGIGRRAQANASNSIQIGFGSNNEASTLCIGNGTYNRKLLDINSGLIPQERINLIKTTMDSVATIQTQYFLGEQTSVSITMPSSANVGNEILVTFSSGATPCALTCNLQGFSFVPKANKTSWIKFTYCASDNWLVETKEG